MATGAVTLHMKFTFNTKEDVTIQLLEQAREDDYKVPLQGDP